MGFVGRGGKVSGCGCDDVHLDVYGDVIGHDDVCVRGEMTFYFEMRLYHDIRLAPDLDYAIFYRRFVSWSS